MVTAWPFTNPNCVSSKVKKTADKSTGWQLEPGHRNEFYLSAVELDSRLSSKPDHKTLVATSNRKSYEKWQILPSPTKLGIFSIRSLQHKHYLGSDEEGHLCVQKEADPWAIEVASPRGGVFLRSIRTQKHLCCYHGGHLYLTESRGQFETWRLEPIVPATMTKQQLYSWIGVGSVAAAVAAPMAVVGVIGALGYQAGGIVGGSMAAGMMSAEAIASGGAIAAGGTVATLQSIGAAGLGVAGTAGAAGTGAVVGGAAAAIAGEKVQTKSQAKTSSTQNTTNFPPLCSWRQW
jgi:Interferon-induced 6-16 family